ncbi:hypothetical protein ACWGDE_01085 [Streptomyces sp. NPDC054956]
MLGDVDLFGYPADEVARALGEQGRDPRLGLPFRSAPPGGYLPSAALRDAPAESRGQVPEPDLDAYADMWTTGREHWLLEETGSGGHLIVTKGDPPMYLTVCHEELGEQIIARMLAAGVEVVPS